MIIIFLSQISNPSLSTVLVAVSIPPLLTAFSYIVSPWRKWFGQQLGVSEGVGALRSDDNDDAYLFYLYGASGSGKTSLIRAWENADDNEGMTTTTALSISKLIVPRSYQTPNIGTEHVVVRVIDYSGQRHSQVTTGLLNTEETLSIGEVRAFDAAVFLVDIVPPQDESLNLLNTREKQLDWLQDDPKTKVKNRVREHEIYINGSLQIVFSVIKNRKLKSVKFVINKIDILEELLAADIIDNNQSLNAAEYGYFLFEGITSEIEKACKDRQIRNFSTHCISALKTQGTRTLMHEILNAVD